MKFLHAFLTVLFLGAPSAGAQTELPQPKGFAGVLLGYADPGQWDGRFGYGAEVGMRWTNGVQGTLQYLTSKAGERDTDITVDHYGLGLDYAFGGTLSSSLSGLRGGVRLGSGVLAVDTGGGKASETAFSYGLAAGYDHQFLDLSGVGVGIELQSWWSQWESRDNVLYALGSLKFWF